MDREQGSDRESDSSEDRGHDRGMNSLIGRLVNDDLRNFIIEAMRLRVAAVAGLVDFYQHYSWGEVHVQWRGDPQAGTGFATFDDLLLATHVDPARYSRFKESVARFGVEHVRSIGLDAIAIILAVPENERSIRDPDVPAAQAILTESLASKARNGVPPSPRQVVTYKNIHYAPTTRREPKALVKDRLAQLEEDNAALRRENSKLKHKLEVADRRVARAEERLKNVRERSRTKKR